MANLGTPFSEGQSTTRPPLFRGVNFGEWKKRMETFLKMNYDLWYIVDECPFIPMISDSPSSKEACVLRPKTRKELDENDKKNLGLNAKALYIMYNALDLQESSRVKGCKDAHEIWVKLHDFHEGIFKHKGRKQIYFSVTV